ncbi:ATP-dependent zinc metalloprotease FTSH 8, mitochondrial-like [Dorcoceras hygrometricum]|uniref:ATP-dependent zinc metalloprotease FTSH 8, mitochondrial-like n=1 Tax=Dorcoceras hygrometricum TaxID=472368 RepID=A0A2Z7BYF8_9LAMI|nr:ATP-dependent zinc metalloprotease FTSH 8, mitochondrial-like [Dorcoceras hygrometricum]
MLGARCAWLRPISRENRLFNGWRLSFSESGPRLKSRSLRQSALENVMNISRMKAPRRDGRNKSDGDDNLRRRATGGSA